MFRRVRRFEHFRENFNDVIKRSIINVYGSRKFYVVIKCRTINCNIHDLDNLIFKAYTGYSVFDGPVNIFAKRNRTILVDQVPLFQIEHCYDRRRRKSR